MAAPLPTLHIIGAGLSGLAAAVRGIKTHKVALYDSAPQAGGRCRSFFDESLKVEIDNGSHLMLGAYVQTLEYLREIGGEDKITTQSPATFPFADLKTGSHWALRLNRGLIPYWLFNPSRRVPHTRVIDYIKDLNLIRKAKPSQTVSQVFQTRSSPLIVPLWRPLTLAILNTDIEQASASILWSALARTLVKGEKACRPLLPKTTLGAALIDPALAYLKGRNAQINDNALLKDILFKKGRVSELSFGDRSVPVCPGDSVILAVSAVRASKLLPDIACPKDHNPITNLHFKISNPKRMLGDAGLLGIVEGTSQWLFERPGMVSVTISNSAKLTGGNEAAFAEHIWQEVLQATQALNTPLPPYRILTEKRATFSQTPDQDATRPGTLTTYQNLYLAGDWTDTGLPATIEGAVLSGFKAVKEVENKIK